MSGRDGSPLTPIDCQAFRSIMQSVKREMTMTWAELGEVRGNQSSPAYARMAELLEFMHDFVHRPPGHGTHLTPNEYAHINRVLGNQGRPVG